MRSRGKSGISFCSVNWPEWHLGQALGQGGDVYRQTGRSPRYPGVWWLKLLWVEVWYKPLCITVIYCKQDHDNCNHDEHEAKPRILGGSCLFNQLPRMVAPHFSQGTSLKPRSQCKQTIDGLEFLANNSPEPLIARSDRP